MANPSRSIRRIHFIPDAGAPTVPAPESILPPDTIPDSPRFPKLPGEPITPEPIPKLPGGPKEGPPIPREIRSSGPVDTPRQPMDIPGLPVEEALPSTKPRPSAIPDGPVTQDAPASGGSAVPTERGLGRPASHTARNGPGRTHPARDGHAWWQERRATTARAGDAVRATLTGTSSHALRRPARPDDVGPCIGPLRTSVDRQPGVMRREELPVWKAGRFIV